MARGKHAIKAARKRERKAKEELQQVRAELDSAKGRIFRLKQEVKEKEALEDLVDRLRRKVKAGTSNELESLQERHEDLKESHREMEEYVQGLRKKWEKAITHALIALGGGFGAFEDLYVLFGERGDEEVPDGAQPILCSADDTVSMSDPKAIRAIERKRRKGNRRTQVQSTRRKTLRRLMEVCPEHEDEIRSLLES